MNDFSTRSRSLSPFGFHYLKVAILGSGILYIIASSQQAEISTCISTIVLRDAIMVFLL
jgi:hypothetical protein